MEEYLGFLRAKMALIEARVAEADEQIGVIREVLDQHQSQRVHFLGTTNPISQPLPLQWNQMITLSHSHQMTLCCGTQVIS